MAHWRDTYKPARFFIMDARAGVIVVVTLLHVRIWTVALMAGTITLFWFLERRGFSLPGAFRAFRAWLIGDDRPARRIFKTRAPIDYERRPD